MIRRLGCTGLILVLALLVAGFVSLQRWAGAGPLRQNATVQIAPGTSVNRVADQLQRQGVIRSAFQFKVFARLFGGGALIKAGEYRVPAHLSASDTLKLLQGGRTLQRFVTIPEGLPAVMVRDVVMAADGLAGRVPVPPEGSVLPDSYSYQRGDTRAGVVLRMQRAMTRYLTTAWRKRSPGLVVTTPREALILASIVEKETGKPSERAMVAAVYSNRLRQHMPLQADPTIIYPITQGRPLGRKILLSEVHAKNAYNTYSMTGLPAGPICNPGRASIEAVLHPANSAALYFVADGTGGHVFSNTLQEQNANVAKWRAYRVAHGI